MNSVAMLDSFQLIVGLYLLYVAIKGSGTLYNFMDIPKAHQAKVHSVLRVGYAVCGVIALAEAAVCMWGPEFLGTETVNLLSSACSSLIIIILAVVFIWLRKLADK